MTSTDWLYIASSWDLNMLNTFLKSCFKSSNTDYLINRAEAALGSIDKVKKGHADYLSNLGGKFAFIMIRHDPADFMPACFCRSVNIAYCSHNQMLEGCWGLWPSSPTWLQIQLSMAAPLHTWHPLIMQTVRNMRYYFALHRLFLF